MSSVLAGYLRWAGVWTGMGETQDGRKTLIRTSFAPAMDGAGLEMHFEAWDPSVSVLYHGVRSVLAVAPSGVWRALAYSTIHGPLVLELMPDDEGVMALSGNSQAGNHLSVTFVEEAPGTLVFTALWRSPDRPLAKPDSPRMTCTLKPARPITP